MKILITGFAGFVGRHFTKRLLADGHTIVGVDNFSAGWYPPKWWLREWRDASKFYAIDIRDYFLQHVPNEFDLVIHCAAVIGGRTKIDGDPLAIATNLAIDAALFNWVVRTTDVATRPRLLYFSSSAVYPLELQTREHNCDLGESLVTFDTMRLSRPDQTYGWCKLSGEYLAKIAADKYGLDVKVYRPFGGYGEDQSMDYPFPSIIRRILMGENPVTVWGSGKQQRDFIHIDDVVEGVLSTMDALAPGEVLNLGTGRGVSFHELASTACRVLDRLAIIVNDATMPEGVYRRVADTHKLFQIYQPKVWLEQGILRVGQHLQKSLDGLKAPV